MRKFLVFITILTILFSCEKAKDISPIPKISFYKTEVVDTGIDSKHFNIYIDFIDGDGDISFYEQDSVKNLVYTIYKFENDTFVPGSLQVPLSFTIPFYEPKGTDKTLQGKIKTKFYIDDLSAAFDTIRFDCYIFDREYHKSNVITTPTIILHELK